MRHIMYITLLSILTLSCAAQAGDIPVYYPKVDPARDRPIYLGVTSAPDCAGATVQAVDADLDIGLSGTTTGGPNQVDAYSCRSWQETGPEFVYELQVSQSVYLHVLLASTVDLDIFLLDACDSEACLAAHTLEFNVLLAARSEPYYLVIDGYDGAAGAFMLHLDAVAAGLPQLACDTAVITADITGCGDTPVTYDGNTQESPNLVTFTECYPYLAYGGENWYRLTVQPDVTLTVDLTNNTFDAILWLFSGCGPNAVCVTYADDVASGYGEQLIFTNSGTEKTDWYLGVDSTHPVTDPLGYDLMLTCDGQATAAEHGNWGSIKKMYK